MKTRLLLFSLATSLLANQTYAQKLDLDQEYWDMRYVKMPLSNTVASLNTYSVAFYGEPDNLTRIGLSSDKIETAVKLSGFVYTPEASDLEIEVNVDAFRVVSESVESKDVSEKDQAGNTVSKKMYYAVARYAAPTTIKIVTKDKEVLVDRILANNQNPVVIESSSYPNYDGANNYLKGSADKRMDAFKARFGEAFQGVFATFKDNYDFTVKKETEVFWHVDVKKNPEYVDFNSKLAEAKGIFESMNVFEDIKVTRDKMAPILQYWRDNAAKTVAEDKRGRKEKYAYLINLSRAQLWLEMLDECEATAKQLIENDYDKLDGKNLLLSVNLFRNELKKTPNGTRHFSREGFQSSTQYRAHDIQPKVIPFKYPKPPVGFKAYPGYALNYSKEKIKGQLWVKDLNSALAFQPKEGTKFVYEENKELKELALDPKTIDEISLGREETIQRFKFKNKMGMPEIDAFFKVLHETDKHKILKYYDTGGFGGGFKSTMAETKLIGTGDLCLYEKSTGVIVPVSALLANKAAENTAAYYEGCADVKNKILAEAFGKMNTLDGQIKALQYFESQCK